MNQVAYKPFVVPSIHPAHALRGQEHFITTIERDLKRAARVADHGWEQQEKCWIPWHDNKTYQKQMVNYCVSMLDYWRTHGYTVAIDTETTRDSVLVNRLKCVSISAYGTMDGIAFPVGDELPVQDRNRLKNALRALALEERCPKIFHNSTFDITVLERHGFPIRGPVYDTLTLSHVLDPDSPHDLGFVSQNYLDTDAWKHDFDQMEKSGSATLYNLLYYNCRDAIATQRLLGPMLEEIQEENLLRTAQYQTQWTEMARRMEVTGIWIDEDKRRELKADLAEKRDSWLNKIAVELNWPEAEQFKTDTRGIRHYNMNKPGFKRTFLFERLGLPVKKYTKKRLDPSTSYKAVLDYLEHPLVQAYVEWLEAAHDLSTYVEGYKKKVLKDGRLHPSWNPTGTVGSRFSSKPNLQNIPKRLKSMIAAPPGRILVGADMEQLEYRISAAFAGCTKLLAAFANGEDAHILTARAVFGSDTIDSVDPKTRFDLRYICKRVIYGLNYGAGAKTVARSIKEDKRTPIHIRARINEGEVKRVIKGIFKVYPEIPLWRNGILEFANAYGYIEIPPLGRKRHFASTPVEATKAWNYPIQTTGSDIVNLALLKMQERIPRTARIILHGHDAVLIECDEKDAEEVARIEEECFEYSLDGPAGPVRLFAEAKIARSYDKI